MATRRATRNRSDTRVGRQKVLDAVVSFFDHHGRIPTKAQLYDLADRHAIAPRTVDDYLNDLANELLPTHNTVHSRRNYYSDVLYQYLFDVGVAERAANRVPTYVVDADFRRALEQVPYLRDVVLPSIRLYLAREPERVADIELLLAKLDSICSTSGPAFRHLQEILHVESDPISFRPGGELPYWLTSHQMSANQGTAPFLPHPKNITAIRAIMPAGMWLPHDGAIDISTNIITTGGVASEVLARILLGYWHTSGDSFARRNDILPLPYWINANSAEVRTIYGESREIVWDESTKKSWIVPEANYPICTGAGEVLHQCEVDRRTGLIMNDFLLITRIKNYFTDTPNRYVLNMAGVRGVGSKAVTLLSDNCPNRAMRQVIHDIDSELQGADEFQILLEVTEIKHDGLESEPMALELRDAVRFTIPDHNIAKLKAWIKRHKELPHWLIPAG